MTEAERVLHDKAINILVVTQAFADGKKIKYKLHGFNEWKEVTTPAWDWSSYDYEIMEEEPKELTLYEQAVEKYGEGFVVADILLESGRLWCRDFSLNEATSLADFAGYVHEGRHAPYKLFLAGTPILMWSESEISKPIAVLFKKEK